MSTVLAPPKPIEVKKAPGTVAAPRRVYDVYGWLANKTRFLPVTYICAAVIAFALCSFAGRLVSKSNVYNNFHRFHTFLSPLTFFYPTVSEMVALVESHSTPEQTIVILGGNSVFNGMGQNDGELWSDDLQQKLGDKFAVFNFAFKGGEPFEAAYWTAENLLKKHRKVIYATVVLPGLKVHPDGSETFGYAYWDAKEKGLLTRDSLRDFAIKQEFKALNPKDQERISELKLRSKLDSLFYFEDLWTAIGYSNLFTVWTDKTAWNFFKPRRDFSEEIQIIPPVGKRFGSEFELGSVRSYCKSYFEYGTATPRQSFWNGMFSDMKSLVPERYKQNCCVWVATHPPYDLNHLKEIEQTRERLSDSLSMKYWKLAGYRSKSLRGLVNDDDFLDGLHLIASGGRKVSQSVAAQVILMNRELGYADIRSSSAD